MSSKLEKSLKRFDDLVEKATKYIENKKRNNKKANELKEKDKK